MTAYCDLADLRYRFGAVVDQVADRDGDGQADPAVIDEAVATAGGEIDGYLRAGGYPVPVDPVPRVVRSIAVDIAYFHLHGDRAPEPVVDRRDRAVKMLQSVARGDLALGVQADRESGAGAPLVDAGTPGLTRDLDRY